MKLITPKHIRRESKTVAMVILKSLDGENDWTPVKPEDVPQFLKVSDNVKRLLGGEMLQLESVDPHWFRGEEVAIH